LKVNYLIGVVMWGERNGKNHNLEKKKYYIMKLPKVPIVGADFSPMAMHSLRRFDNHT